MNRGNFDLAVEALESKTGKPVVSAANFLPPGKALRTRMMKKTLKNHR